MYTYVNKTGAKMFNTAKNTTAYAKLSFCKKLKLFKMLVAFNVTQRNAKGKLLFPVQQKCNFVSGHFDLQDLHKQLANAQDTLRTQKIVIVD
jgi:hypothetical protein